MPGETKSDISGWTVDTLKAYVERLFDEHDKRYEQRFLAQQQSLTDALKSSNLAVDKAENIAEKWRANANEWRAAMTDKDKNFLTKDVARGYFLLGIMAAGLMVALAELVIRSVFK